MQVFRFLLFPKYFILFIAVVSEIIFFISLLDSLLFVYRGTVNFMFISYPEALLN